jgi:hypothetical protein
VVKDILALFEQSALDLEHRLLSLVMKERQDHGERLQQAVFERMNEVAPSLSPRWRVIKRRWQQEIKRELEAALTDLYEMTRY